MQTFPDLSQDLLRAGREVVPGEPEHAQALPHHGPVTGPVVLKGLPRPVGLPAVDLHYEAIRLEEQVTTPPADDRLASRRGQVGCFDQPVEEGLQLALGRRPIRRPCHDQALENRSATMACSTMGLERPSQLWQAREAAAQGLIQRALHVGFGDGRAEIDQRPPGGRHRDRPHVDEPEQRARGAMHPSPGWEPLRITHAADVDRIRREVPQAKQRSGRGVRCRRAWPAPQHHCQNTLRPGCRSTRNPVHGRKDPDKILPGQVVADGRW